MAETHALKGRNAKKNALKGQKLLAQGNALGYKQQQCAL